MVQRPLTVLQVLPALESGGVEQGVLEIGAELVQRGHRSIIISAGGYLAETLKGGGSEHYTWPIGAKSPWTLGLVLRLRRFLSEQQVDILHAHSRVPAWVAWLAWWSMPESIRPRFVTTVHGLYSVNRYSRIMTWGEKVITVSERARQYVLENYPEVRLEQLIVIPWGVDPELYPYGYQPSREWLARWERDYPQLQGKKILTLPGRLTRLKGHQDFIELIGRLRERGCPVHGLIVGGEDPRRQRYADEIRRQISHEGLQGAVTFTGHRSDLREIYAISDLVLSLSKKPESFGRTVLEALSLGVPVIGYDHGGVGEVLGQLFPEGRVPVANLSILSEQVIQFIKAPPKVPKQRCYTLQRMLAQTLQCYRTLCGFTL
ncbi:Glycosyl transferase, group 1 [Nitrosococcus oceani ATCC 19707]|uniref:Glycosyl transferase, group 1 n=2 Tax=Nitrosococcus oceani TaxID=1229 RepID=Q3JDL6_NITOC|nr:glycosyltransferase family 4 protein [Nitrosococcus oceani]ABA57080.1 Glycosyl transferase, group 1 [Nitrosococcus oceani ATCC 19707]EDZ65830.1 glycosyl transferase, group 1 family protein [Nitrosococcus oceani AFC27]KFI20488.1 glycosyl transferase [Nitrosococcus oceani C-27]GEM19905.1 glycosyl transferase [Nitrosococcus oceani]